MIIESEQESLPIGWKETVLGEILFLKNGFAFKSNSYQDAGTPVIRISDIQDGVVTTKVSIRIKASEEFNNYFVHKGDILIAMSGATTGKFGIYKQDDLAFQNQRVGNFRLYSDELVNKKIIFFLLGNLKREIEKKAYGGAQPNISGKNIENLKFNLPPLPEQHKIVAKIEELFSELDNGIENLKKAREQLKTYRQAVLKYAFEGKLTEEWRTRRKEAGNPPEPTKKLMEQIKKERENYYQKQFEDWKKACEKAKSNGKKKPTKPKTPKELPLLTEKELVELPALPAGWCWKKFGEVCEKIFDGTHFSPQNFIEGDYKYVTAKNIKESRIDLDNITYVSEDVHDEIYSKADVKKNDVLYIKDGVKTGIAAVNYLEEEFSLLSSVGVFRTNQNYISSKYLCHYLNSPITRNRMLSNVAGVAITRLTLVKLNHSYFAFAPKDEQIQIVQEIESRLSVCDQLEQTIEDSLKKAEAVRQSILKKAFTGELTKDWRDSISWTI